MKNDVDSIYIKESKYLLYLLKLRFNIINKPLDRFGKSEKSLEDESKTHSYFWLDQLPIENLHPRLKYISSKII